MKNYDFQKANSYIEENKEQIQKASLGMKEDWSWTADTVFEDGNYSINLDNCQGIGGINGSIWATPILEVNFKDGRTEIVDCYSEDGKQATAQQIAMGKSFASGTGGKGIGGEPIQ